MKSSPAVVVRSPRLAARRREVRAHRRRRRLRIIAAVVATASLCGGAWGMSRTPVFGIQSIEVRGADQGLRASIVAASGLKVGAPALSLDLDAAARSVEALPVIAGARLTRSSTLGLVIHVRLRRPVVEVRSPEGRTMLGRDGRAVPLAPTGPLPVLEHRGEVSDELVAEVLSIWTALPAKLRAKAGAFRVGDRGIEATVKRTRVVFGDARASAAKVQALVLLRARVRGEGRTLLVADLRAPRRPVAILA